MMTRRNAPRTVVHAPRPRVATGGGAARTDRPEVATPADEVDATRATPPIGILFLCSANSARSQIAEALLARRGGGRFRVASAGTHPALHVAPEAVAALAVAGIDWSGRRPKGLEAVVDQSWDLIITTCERARESCPAFPGRPIYAHWNVPDPAAVTGERRNAAFVDALHLLARRIDLMLALRQELLDRAVARARLVALGVLAGDASRASTD